MADVPCRLEYSRPNEGYIQSHKREPTRTPTVGVCILISCSIPRPLPQWFAILPAIGSQNPVKSISLIPFTGRWSLRSGLSCLLLHLGMRAHRRIHSLREVNGAIRIHADGLNSFRSLKGPGLPSGPGPTLFCSRLRSQRQAVPTDHVLYEKNKIQAVAARRRVRPGAVHWQPQPIKWKWKCKFKSKFMPQKKKIRHKSRIWSFMKSCWCASRLDYKARRDGVTHYSYGEGFLAHLPQEVRDSAEVTRSRRGNLSSCTL